MPKTIFAAVAALSLAAAALPATAATVVDASTYNTSGPGVTNELQPGLSFWSSLKPAPRILSTTARATNLGATSSVDASTYNLSGPGVVNSQDPRAVPAAGLGAPSALASLRPDDGQSAIATQPVSGSIYNTAEVGTLSGQNPGLLTAGHRSRRLAAISQPGS